MLKIKKKKNGIEIRTRDKAKTLSKVMGKWDRKRGQLSLSAQKVNKPGSDLA